MSKRSRAQQRKMMAGPETTGAYGGAATGRAFKKAMKDITAQVLRESQPPSRVRTVKGFQLLMTKEGGSWQDGKYRGGRWRYSGHGETGLRVRELQGQGHGRALKKALR